MEGESPPGGKRCAALESHGRRQVGSKTPLRAQPEWTRLCKKRLFWDTDPERVDPEREASWVIPRVLTEGDLEDAKTLFRLYGPARIREVVRTTRSVPRARLALWDFYFAWERRR